jgi:hypothetical protein
VLEFPGNDRATWNAAIVGVAVVAYASIEVDMSKPWEEWVNLLPGV